MKNVLAATVLAAALAACATPYAPPEFDSLAIATGMVEAVQQVPLRTLGFEDAIEHSVKPRLAEQVRVRLDDGRALTLEGVAQRFAPGQRVRVVAGRVAPE